MMTPLELIPWFVIFLRTEYRGTAA